MYPKISAIYLIISLNIYEVPPMYLTKPNPSFRKHSGKEENFASGELISLTVAITTTSPFLLSV